VWGEARGSGIDCAGCVLAGEDGPEIKGTRILGCSGAGSGDDEGLGNRAFDWNGRRVDCGGAILSGELSDEGRGCIFCTKWRGRGQRFAAVGTWSISLFLKSGHSFVWKWIRFTCSAPRGFGGKAALADREPADRRDCSESGNTRTVFYGVDVRGLRDRGLEGRSIGDGWDVLAGICICRCDSKIFTAPAEVAHGGSVSGRSECGSGGADGVCWMAICAGDVAERASDCNRSNCDCFVVAIQDEFGVVGVGRGSGGDFVEVIAFRVKRDSSRADGPNDDRRVSSNQGPPLRCPAH